MLQYFKTAQDTFPGFDPKQYKIISAIDKDFVKLLLDTTLTFTPTDTDFFSFLTSGFYFLFFVQHR